MLFGNRHCDGKRLSAADYWGTSATRSLYRAQKELGDSQYQWHKFRECKAGGDAGTRSWREQLRRLFGIPTRLEHQAKDLVQTEEMEMEMDQYLEHP